MDTYYTTQTHVTPNPMGEPVPWFMRHNRPSHRPFAAFASSKPTAPPAYPFGLPASERARIAADEAFLDRQALLSVTRGAPATPPPSPGGVSHSSFVRPWRPERAPEPRVWTIKFGMARWRRLKTGIRNAATRGWARKREVQEEVRRGYRRTAFAWERKYWLSLTAYRQSGWPAILGFLGRFMLVLLAIGLVSWLFQIRLADLAKHPRPRGMYKGAPEYAVWSVSKSGC